MRDRLNIMYETFNKYLFDLSYIYVQDILFPLFLYFYDRKHFIHGSPNTVAILYRLQCIDRLRQLPTLYVISERQPGRWNRNFPFLSPLAATCHYDPTPFNALDCLPTHRLRLYLYIYMYLNITHTHVFIQMCNIKYICS